MTTPSPESAREPRGRTDGPAPDLGWSLAVVLQRWHERVEESLADVPHGSRGYHVLVACAAAEVPTQAALAERLLIDRSVMTYLLDDLEAADLVRRRVDDDDRRVRRVCVTAHGREVLADLAARVAHVEERVLAGLDEGTRALFCAAARTAAVAIQESSPDLDPCAAVRTVVGDPSAARRTPRRRPRARS
ncbi:MarR family winged helix-turn-helix transcriptional regulator [Nocardiopsis sp. NPDC006139]|uniref:MarR family winged helix-turn-helix transcriptional regulator n=1 Tax=Nocardiopsis TaxID=2013 RepID=UPI0033B62755